VPYVYVGTQAQVDQVRTAALLLVHDLHVIWCPPPGIIPWNAPNWPVGGEDILLAWRADEQAQLVPIGVGQLLPTPAPPKYGTQVLWTMADLPAVNPFSQPPTGVGYGGGQGASYLRLEHVGVVPQLDVAPLVAAFPPLQAGMNEIPGPAPWGAGAALPCGC